MAKLYWQGDSATTTIVITDRDPVIALQEFQKQYGPYITGKAPDWDLVREVGEQEEFVDEIDGHCCGG